MAEWKPFDLKWGRSIWYCSACEESTEVPTYLGTPMYNFCPMCGANMNMKKADGCKTEPTISKMEQVDEPMKTTDYCDICKRDMCEICIADATNPYCVPSHYEINYEPKDEPQDEYAKEYEELGLRKLKELRKGEPQIDCKTCKHSSKEEESDECYTCSMYYNDNYEPQTGRSE